MSQVRKKKILWDNYKVIDGIQKSDNIKIVVAIGCRDGVRYLNIREFYLKKSTNEWKPSRDGLTIPLRVPIKTGTQIITPFAALIQILIKAVKELEELPLYDENNVVYYVTKLDEGEEDNVED